jgi:hypothetical protein
MHLVPPPAVNPLVGLALGLEGVDPALEFLGGDKLFVGHVYMIPDRKM